MRKANDTPLRIKVADGGRDGRRRKITIEIDAPVDGFELVDVLARYGALDGIEDQLRTGVEALISQYLETGLSVVRDASRSRATPALSENHKREREQPPTPNT